MWCAFRYSSIGMGKDCKVTNMGGLVQQVRELRGCLRDPSNVTFGCLRPLIRAAHACGGGQSSLTSLLLLLLLLLTLQKLLTHWSTYVHSAASSSFIFHPCICT